MYTWKPKQPIFNGCLVNHLIIWNHPTKTTIFKRPFQVPGRNLASVDYYHWMYTKKHFADTPWKINIWNLKMKMDGRWVSFSIFVMFRFQPLILRGVTFFMYKWHPLVPVCWASGWAESEERSWLLENSHLGATAWQSKTVESNNKYIFAGESIIHLEKPAHQKNVITCAMFVSGRV